jgi:hypothetical protein
MLLAYFKECQLGYFKRGNQAAYTSNDDMQTSIEHEQASEEGSEKENHDQDVVSHVCG